MERNAHVRHDIYLFALRSEMNCMMITIYIGQPSICPIHQMLYRVPTPIGFEKCKYPALKRITDFIETYTSSKHETSTQCCSVVVPASYTEVLH